MSEVRHVKERITAAVVFSVVMVVLVVLVVVISGCVPPPTPPTPAKPQLVPEPTPQAPANAVGQEVPTTPPPPPPQLAEQPQEQSKVHRVVINTFGFNPSILVIKAGETVEFYNNDSVPHRPASASHPTHTVYPEPGGCVGSKFDSCKDLAYGESFKFIFNQKGTWSYHDHLKYTTRGRVVVE